MDVLDTTEPSPVRQQGDMERVCAFSKRRRVARRRGRRGSRGRRRKSEGNQEAGADKGGRRRREAPRGMDDERRFSFRCEQGEKSELKRNERATAAPHPPTQPSGPMYALATRASKPTTGLHVRTGRGSYVLGNHWACELRNGFASKARTSVCLRVTGGCWWQGELSHYTVRVRERHGDDGPLQIYHRACGHTWTGSLVVKAVVWVGPYCWL